MILIANIYGLISCSKAQILAYVEYFGQFTADSEQFPENVAQVLHLLPQFSICWGKIYAKCVYLLLFFFPDMQLIQSCYPSKENRLVDEVLGNTTSYGKIIKQEVQERI